MDSTKPAAGGGSSSDASAVQRDIRALRLTLQITLVSLLILSGSIGIYLFRQVSLMRRQVDGSTRAAEQMGKYFNETLSPQAQVFEQRLQEFARTNADLRARIARFYTPSAPTNSAPAGAVDVLPGLPAVPPPFADRPGQ